MRRVKVASKRNSHINVPLDWLDWSNWWTDNSFGNCYLHVHGNAASDPDGEYGLKDRVFRVYARRKNDETEPPRIEMIKGELYWLISKPDAEDVCSTASATTNPAPLEDPAISPLPEGVMTGEAGFRRGLGRRPKATSGCRRASVEETGEKK